MQTKLTLRMEQRLIEKAKAWAKTRDVSLSQAVAQFFETLPPNTDADDPMDDPWIRSLTGIGLRPGETPPTDEQVEEEVLAYLTDKYS